MIEHSAVFKNLLKNLQQVPYLASKNIYRVAEYFLLLDKLKTEQFQQAIAQAKEQIVQCHTCFTWQEKGKQCPFCGNSARDTTKICVVETWQDLLSIEKTGGYKGLYHVLGGALCPLEGRGPESLTLTNLFNRITEAVSELIIATNQTPEGEATAAYIAHKLQDRSSHLIISCLARGVPVGSVLTFMDRVTLYKALSDRRPF